MSDVEEAMHRKIHKLIIDNRGELGTPDDTWNLTNDEYVNQVCEFCIKTMLGECNVCFKEDKELGICDIWDNANMPEVYHCKGCCDDRHNPNWTKAMIKE